MGRWFASGTPPPAVTSVAKGKRRIVSCRTAPSVSAYCGGTYMGERFDLAVIGSGQGGVPLALEYAKRGQRVVLFERGRVGGCCVNVGCTPSKSFLASAHAAGRARRAEPLGVRAHVEVDVPAVMER